MLPIYIAGAVVLLLVLSARQRSVPTGGGGGTEVGPGAPASASGGTPGGHQAAAPADAQSSYETRSVEYQRYVPPPTAVGTTRAEPVYYGDGGVSPKR